MALPTLSLAAKSRDKEKVCWWLSYGYIADVTEGSTVQTMQTMQLSIELCRVPQHKTNTHIVRKVKLSP
jgi:hypothetical protein